MKHWIIVLSIVIGSTTAFAQEGEKHKPSDPTASEPTYTAPKSSYDDEVDYKTYQVSPSPQEQKSCVVDVTVETPTQEIIEFKPKGCETYDGIDPELFFDNKGHHRWMIHFDGEGEKPDSNVPLEFDEHKPGN